MSSCRHLQSRSCSLAEFVVAAVLLVGVVAFFSKVGVNKINLPPQPLPTPHRRPPSPALTFDSSPASVAMGRLSSLHPTLLLVDALGLGLCASLACGAWPSGADPSVRWFGVPWRAGGVAELRPSVELARRRSPPWPGRARRWRPQLQSTWGPTQLLHHVGLLLFLQVTPKSKDPISAGGWQGAIKACYVEYVKQKSISTLRPGKKQTGTSFKQFLFSTFDSKHGSDKAPLNVRADLRLQSMLVLRFNVERSRAKNTFRPVKPIRHLRLKIPNPRRHRPVRQSRRAPAVLSECNYEDPRCLWRGLQSSLAQRLRQRHHLCLLHQKCFFQILRSPSTLGFERSYLSQCFDSFAVAQKLQLCLEWMIPKPCTPLLLY